MTARDDGAHDIEVFQNLVVYGVEVEGTEVRADVYGGDESICGTVLYRLDDECAVADKVRILRRWSDDATPVTYVRRGTAASLMDEAAVFSDALGF